MLIVFSAFCFLAAVWRELTPGGPRPQPDTRRIPVGLLAPVNGFLVIVDIAALAGVWLVRS